MTGESKEIVKTLLAGIHEPRVVQELCATDVTYVSLNYSNPELHKIVPWCGTGHGVEAISKTFHDVAEFWTVESFTPEDIFGEGDKVMVFARFM